MKNLEEVIKEAQSKVDFSGAVMVQNGNGLVESASFGNEIGRASCRERV